jgi:hypothetical protein
MARVIKQIERVAIKQHDCDASEWIINYGSLSELFSDTEMSFADKRKIIKARDEHFKILPKSRYYEQVVEYEGSIYTVRGRIDMVEICQKYDLFCD